MKGYKLRKGDLLIIENRTGFITKTTPGYIYYLFEGHISRVKKETLWRYLDTDSRVEVSYGSQNRRRPQKRMRILNLHGTFHRDAEEKIKKFLNFVELPCKIITGDSKKMKLIVEDIVDEYGWAISELNNYNPGTLIVVER
tara:strand:- start:617 stop:1039 length:423 start_codon:yes stop_codon:yes gene_type:complete